MQQRPVTGTDARRVESPVDDYTYDLLQALTSKLEAIEAYEMYADDGGGSGLFSELAQEDRRQADRLLDELRKQLASGR